MDRWQFLWPLKFRLLYWSRSITASAYQSELGRESAKLYFHNHWVSNQGMQSDQGITLRSKCLGHQIAGAIIHSVSFMLRKWEIIIGIIHYHHLRFMVNHHHHHILLIQQISIFIKTHSVPYESWHRHTTYSIPICDNTMGALWVIISPNFWYENGYSIELHDPMGYDAIHYALNYLALWIAAQNYRPLYAITIFRNSGTLNIHLLFFIINNHLGDHDPDRRQRRRRHHGYQQGLS